MCVRCLLNGLCLQVRDIFITFRTMNRRVGDRGLSLFLWTAVCVVYVVINRRTTWRGGIRNYWCRLEVSTLLEPSNIATEKSCLLSFTASTMTIGVGLSLDMLGGFCTDVMN